MVREITDKDKRFLMDRLNGMGKDDHVFIFRNIIAPNVKDDVYTVTNQSTLLDLNDLPPVIFWRINECVEHSMFTEKKVAIQSECERNMQAHMKKLEDSLAKLSGEAKIADEMSKEDNEDKKEDGILSYDELRRRALSQCSYSSYFDNRLRDSDKITLPGDREEYRNIYSNVKSNRSVN